MEFLMSDAVSWILSFLFVSGPLTEPRADLYLRHSVTPWPTVKIRAEAGRGQERTVVTSTKAPTATWLLAMSAGFAHNGFKKYPAQLPTQSNDNSKCGRPSQFESLA